MAKYSFLVMTNAVTGQDNEFNKWYDEVHLPDVIKVPGFVAGQRFSLAEMNPPQSHPYQYAAIYEVETDDLGAVKRALSEIAGTSAMVISPALDRSGTSAAYFQPIGQRQVAGQ